VTDFAQRQHGHGGNGHAEALHEAGSEYRRPVGFPVLAAPGGHLFGIERGGARRARRGRRPLVANASPWRMDQAGSVAVRRWRPVGARINGILGKFFTGSILGVRRLDRRITAPTVGMLSAAIGSRVLIYGGLIAL